MSNDVVEKLEIVNFYVNSGHYAAGFISYEAAVAFDPAFKVKNPDSFPLIWFGIYKNAESINPFDYARKDYFLEPWSPSIDKKKYTRDIRHIKEYIAAGETYQVNYTYRLYSKFSGDPFSLFLDLVENQKTHYSAYMDIGDFAIASVSPELFFKLDGEEIISRPMKGTVSRGRYLSEDEEKARWLHQSQKNRAENVMIVDMMRNDLSRIASTGSVQVESLYDIERYQTALQMTSTVSAQTNASFDQIFTALFPCASITGAPKYRTMKIISELETTPRKIYTGCLGFITPQRKAQFNVSIRTVLIDRKKSQAEYGIGGGIVWESDIREEFQESLTKSRVLVEKRPPFDLLETMLWQSPDGYFLLDHHLKRLSDSAFYFQFPYDENRIREKLVNMESFFSNKPFKVRLLLGQNGKFVCQYEKIKKLSKENHVRLRLSDIHVDSSNLFLYHKTTFRDIYESAKKQDSDCDDIVLFNEKDEITETSIYNIVIKVNEQLLTPPVKCGLLPGTFRAWLFAHNHIKEKVLKLKDLQSCDEIYVINSVRKWQKAILIPV